ncbi:MAG: hemolysin family protein [Candidatus Izemoplasmatales bacterium]|jgi:CBS domain containing-hemolysin-like protein|nr:hemolysin family protein [Candidatus Izemoplasmatales bacterium]
MIILLFVSAFFSMSEMAYAAVGKVRLKTLLEQDAPGSKKAYWIAENFDRTLTTLLVGNNLANIALTTVSVVLFNGIFAGITNMETIVSVLNTVIMTIIILTFGEIFPKSIAKNNPEKVALKISGFLYFLIKIMTPLTFLFRKLNQHVINRSENDQKLTVTEDELETIIDTMEEEGSIDEEEAEMLQRVLDLPEITVEEIMTPRVDMVAIDVSKDVNEITELFFKHKFSRIPVYEDTSDNIIGILYERDFFTKLIKGHHVNVKKILKKPLFIPATTKVDALIELLQLENSHIAVVVDEYGGVDGIVTMEDALEELVGEIYDEHDEIEQSIVKRSDKQYVIDADVDLKILFEELHLGTPPESDSTSVGGWLFEMFQDIPEVGEKIEYVIAINQSYNELSELESEDTVHLSFEVLKVNKRRIKSVLLTIIAVDDSEPSQHQPQQ